MAKKGVFTTSNFFVVTYKYMLAVKCNPAVVKIEKRINKAVVKSAVKVIDKCTRTATMLASMYSERWPEFLLLFCIRASSV